MFNLAIIQARIGSTRLPGKVLLDLEGKTVLEHVVNRVCRSRLITEVFVATTILKEDMRIVKLCSDRDFRVFCGSEEDVLDRYYQAAKLIKPDNIVRITADCPMIDSVVIDKVVKKHIEENADYTTNTLTETYPDGEDVEVFTLGSLEKAWSETILKSEREHVTPYIRKNDEIFKLLNVYNNTDLSSKRWTLDNHDDYEFIKIVFSKLYQKNNFFGMIDVFELLETNPEIEKINSHITRNEGYKKSLNNDGIFHN